MLDAAVRMRGHHNAPSPLTAAALRASDIFGSRRSRWGRKRRRAGVSETSTFGSEISRGFRRWSKGTALRLGLLSRCPGARGEFFGHSVGAHQAFSRPGGRLFLMVPTTEGHGHFRHDLADVEQTAKAQGWEIAVLGAAVAAAGDTRLPQVLLAGPERDRGQRKRRCRCVPRDEDVRVCRVPSLVRSSLGRCLSFSLARSTARRSKPLSARRRYIAGLLKRPPAGGTLDLTSRSARTAMPPCNSPPGSIEID